MDTHASTSPDSPSNGSLESPADGSLESPADGSPESPPDHVPKGPTVDSPTGLTADVLGDDPLGAYRQWVAAARDAGETEPDAATVATATPDGTPSARPVLIRVVDADGVIFFTNRNSRKARELAANPQVALTALWAGMHRCVRIEGTAEWATDDESDAYWATRPHGSRLAAVASPQSESIARADLEERWARLQAQYPAGSWIPRPDHWGGIRVRPTRIEFWQGREFRLHDRIVYERSDTTWTTDRLAP